MCKSISVTQNDQPKRETKVTLHSQVILLRVLNQFLLSKNAIECIYGILVKLEIQTM